MGAEVDDVLGVGEEVPGAQHQFEATATHVIVAASRRARKTPAETVVQQQLSRPGRDEPPEQFSGDRQRGGGVVPLKRRPARDARRARAERGPRRSPENPPPSSTRARRRANGRRHRPRDAPRAVRAARRIHSACFSGREARARSAPAARSSRNPAGRRPAPGSRVRRAVQRSPRADRRNCRRRRAPSSTVARSSPAGLRLDRHGYGPSRCRRGARRAETAVRAVSHKGRWRPRARRASAANPKSAASMPAADLPPLTAPDPPPRPSRGRASPARACNGARASAPARRPSARRAVAGLLEDQPETGERADVARIALQRLGDVGRRAFEIAGVEAHRRALGSSLPPNRGRWRPPCRAAAGRADSSRPRTPARRGNEKISRIGAGPQPFLLQGRRSRPPRPRRRLSRAGRTARRSLRPARARSPAVRAQRRVAHRRLTRGGCGQGDGKRKHIEAEHAPNLGCIPPRLISNRSDVTDQP